MKSARTMVGLFFASIFATSPGLGQSAWTLVEDFRLGGAADGPDSFGGVRSIAVAKNGNIFVVDAKPLQIKLFSPTGKFLRNVGRTGQGPGEYTDIGALLLDAQGNIQVIAPKSGRILAFSQAGEFVRQTIVPFQRFPIQWGGAITRDGSLLDPIQLPSTNRASSTSETRFALQRISASGVRSDTLLFPRCALQNNPREHYVHVPTSNGSYFQTRIPFLPEPQIVFANDGTAWCAPGDVYAIYHFRIGRTDTLHVARINVSAPPLSETERANLQDLISRASNGNSIESPKVKPTLGTIRIDDANRLWVRRTATPEKSPSFDVFDSQARLLASVKTNLRWIAIPLVVGDTAYGQVLSDDDVPLLVRAHIRR